MRQRNNVKISDFTLLKQKKFFLKLFWILGATYTVHNIKDHVDTYFTYPSIVTPRISAMVKYENKKESQFLIWPVSCSSQLLMAVSC